MSDTARVLLITGDQLRHRWVASTLHRTLGLAGVVSEQVPALPVDSASATLTEDEQIIQKHFEERDAVEKVHLGREVDFPEVPVRHVPRGESNSPETRAWVSEQRPDVVFLYGSSIIRPPLLTDYPTINLHLGLSPYYRGSGTNFWPLANGEPECVGCTIHLAVEDVDAGGVLHQVRPPVEPVDRAHEMGTKALMAAVAAIPAVVEAYRAGRIQPVKQDLSAGTVYKRRDFDAASVRRLWANLESGMIREYAEAQDTRNARFPIVGQV